MDDLLSSPPSSRLFFLDRLRFLLELDAGGDDDDFSSVLPLTFVSVMMVKSSVDRLAKLWYHKMPMFMCHNHRRDASKDFSCVVCVVVCCCLSWSLSFDREDVGQMDSPRLNISTRALRAQLQEQTLDRWLWW